jgi:hypothetical protein
MPKKTKETPAPGRNKVFYIAPGDQTPECPYCTPAITEDWAKVSVEQINFRVPPEAPEIQIAKQWITNLVRCIVGNTAMTRAERHLKKKFSISLDLDGAHVLDRALRLKAGTRRRPAKASTKS